MRHTKIICTIGPQTESQEAIEKLIEAGMNIARINLSHGDAEWHKKVITNCKQAHTNYKFPIAILLDTQGPEIRTSTQEAELEAGDSFKIAVNSACDVQEDEKHTFINYEEILNSVKKGDVILIDDGLIALEVTNIEKYHIDCTVLNKGSLGKKKSVNLPGIKVNLPAVTDHDKDAIKALANLGIDFVAQSFVTKKSDVEEMRAFLDSIQCDASIIAKIEDQEGIDNIDEIMEVADAIMVARGDLGVELSFEQIPLVQKMLVEKSTAAAKPVIVATHLLESMITNPRPTRAEVTDVSNAINQKVDAIMLSAETTKGNYPVESVETMHKIAKTTQKTLDFNYLQSQLKTKDVLEAIAVAACINAHNLDAKAILVLSKSGSFTRRIAKNRPTCDIFSFTDNDSEKNKLMLSWATFGFHVDFTQQFNKMIDQAIAILKEQKFLKKDDLIVVVSDILPKKGIETLEIRNIE